MRLVKHAAMLLALNALAAAATLGFNLYQDSPLAQEKGSTSIPKADAENCSTSGQFRTCTVTEPWGVRTTTTDLRASRTINTEFGEKVQNIRSIRMVFNDADRDNSTAVAMVGMFMMLVLPSSTADERWELLNRIGRMANRSSVQAYGLGLEL